jgi:hypothetical protein
MATILAAILGVLAFGVLCCAWRAWVVFRTCVPAAANVETSTYTEQMRAYDAPWGYGWYTHGRPGVRFIRDQVRFEEGDGKQRTAWVSRWVSRRYPPFETYVVWYDPSSGRVTANGPGYWAGFSVTLAIVFATLVVCAVQVNELRSRKGDVAWSRSAGRR